MGFSSQGRMAMRAGRGSISTVMMQAARVPVIKITVIRILVTRMPAIRITAIKTAVIKTMVTRIMAIKMGLTRIQTAGCLRIAGRVPPSERKSCLPQRLQLCLALLQQYALMRLIMHQECCLEHGKGRKTMSS